ncbi:MAG: hypothetical protein IPL53_10675 [Ignavibacteria bacterium]|nr:hypothetical protein [Ignavibacteria bacterium]
MKKFLIIVAVILTTYLIPNNSHAQLTGGWTIQYENAYLQDIKFLNENTGIAVGYSGKILKTTNSGNNWTSVNSGTLQNLNSVSISETTCFIAGDLGVILKSSDQGDSWIILNSGTTSNLHSIAFKASDLCFAAGENGTLLRSPNSGINWAGTFNDASVNFNSLSFINERNIWAVGQKSNLGIMIKTTNFGTSWIDVIPDITKYYKGKSILFLDSLKGYCGFCSTVAQWGFLVTTNGGETWDCRQAGFASPISIFFVNDSFGVCVQDMNPSIWIYNSTSWSFSSLPFFLQY